MQSVLNDETARYNSADLNVAYKMRVDEYQRLCPYSEALEENWGKPPGISRTSCLPNILCYAGVVCCKTESSPLCSPLCAPYTHMAPGRHCVGRYTC